MNKYTSLFQKNAEVDQTSLIEVYEGKVEAMIRQRYTLGRELSILRKKDINPDEFREYYEFVEMCKIEVKAQLGMI